MWFRWMLVAFFANGLGPFGLRILAERGLSEQCHFQYLILWYLSGFLIAFFPYLRHRQKPSLWETLVGLGMGFSSVVGQVATALALEHDIPGHVVFPVTTGGSLFVVAAIGMLIFKERVGFAGLCGILAGTASLVLLTMG
jgi:multidrug transporter EmrE-like cation transporter